MCRLHLRALQILTHHIIISCNYKIDFTFEVKVIIRTFSKEKSFSVFIYKRCELGLCVLHRHEDVVLGIFSFTMTKSHVVFKGRQLVKEYLK